jgi:hypothetical protein
MPSRSEEIEWLARPATFFAELPVIRRGTTATGKSHHVFSSSPLTPNFCSKRSSLRCDCYVHYGKLWVRALDTEVNE